MVMLLFYVGEERYACACDQVLKVVPRVPLKHVAHAPTYLAGLLRYGGFLVPVVDFAQLRDGRPGSNSLSTRIVIFQEQWSAENPKLMGLLAERLTETIEQAPTDFVQHNVVFKNTPYLTGVLGDDHGVIQLVDIAQLFPIVHSVFSEV